MPADAIQQLRTWRLPVSSRTTFLFFELLTTSGQSGIGEATAIGDDITTAKLAQRLFDDLVAERPVSDIPLILSSLTLEAGPTASFAQATAASALDQCLWDLRGKALGLPVHALLGGRIRDRVELYANINRGLVGRSPDEFAERAAAAAADGFTRIKCAPFDQVRPHHGPDAPLVRRGLERLHAVRAVIGDRVDLMVDCHGRLSLETCLALLAEFTALQLCWLEEPLITHDWMNQTIGAADGTAAPTYAPHDVTSSYPAIRESGIRLAGAEFEHGVDRFSELLAAGVLSVLMPDVKYCGGLRTAMTVDMLAAAHGVTIAPHNPSGPVATLASAHLCIAAAAFEVLEYQWGEVTRPEDLLSPYEPRVGNTLTCSDRPGFGSSLNYSALRESSAPLS